MSTMNHRNPLLILTNRLPPPNVHIIRHNGRTFARYLSLAEPLLHCLSMSPSRAIGTFAVLGSNRHKAVRCRNAGDRR